MEKKVWTNKFELVKSQLKTQSGILNLFDKFSDWTMEETTEEEEETNE